MKTVLNGKTYNTDTMTVLVENKRYNNGNYSGSDSIRVTRNGAYAYVSLSNGQNLYRESYIQALTKNEVASRIDGWELTDEEYSALVEHGIVVEA